MPNRIDKAYMRTLELDIKVLQDHIEFGLVNLFAEILVSIAVPKS